MYKAHTQCIFHLNVNMYIVHTAMSWSRCIHQTYNSLVASVLYPPHKKRSKFNCSKLYHCTKHTYTFVYICAWFGRWSRAPWYGVSREFNVFTDVYACIIWQMCTLRLHDNKVFYMYSPLYKNTKMKQKEREKNNHFMVCLNSPFSHIHFNQCHYKLLHHYRSQNSTLCIRYLCVEYILFILQKHVPHNGHD